MNPLSKQAWSTAGFSRTMNYSVRANVFISSLLCSPAREATRRIVKGKEESRHRQLPFFLSRPLRPLCTPQRNSLSDARRLSRWNRCIMRQFYLAPQRPQSPVLDPPPDRMSHIMRHMERNFRHDTVRIIRIEGRTYASSYGDRYAIWLEWFFDPGSGGFWMYLFHEVLLFYNSGKS